MVIMAFQQSAADEDHSECPLCMELFEVDDFNFFPCPCGYQICQFCWHRIRTHENGLCPACRAPYSENPAEFKPLTEEEVQRFKKQGKQKDQQQRRKTVESRKCLAGIRVVQRNLIFVVGLPPRLSDPDVLKKHEYFGKFGKIHKVVINPCTSYAGSQIHGPSSGAYVTYYRAEDAVRALDAVNNVHVDGRVLKASLGTTKYCSHYLKGTVCPKADCMYLHEPGEKAASFTKEDMQQGKHLEYEQWLKEKFQHVLSSGSSQSQSQSTAKSKQESSDHEISPKNGTVSNNKQQHTAKETWPSVQQPKVHHRSGSGGAPGSGRVAAQKGTEASHSTEAKHRLSPDTAAGSTNGSRSTASSSAGGARSGAHAVAGKTASRGSRRRHKQHKPERTSSSPDVTPASETSTQHQGPADLSDSAAQTSSSATSISKEPSPASAAEVSESTEPAGTSEPLGLGLGGLSCVPAHLQPFLVGDNSSVYSSQAGFFGMPTRQKSEPLQDIVNGSVSTVSASPVESSELSESLRLESCTDWQQAFSRQLQQSQADAALHRPPNSGVDSVDDDLDFDPWSESSRGLQEMLRESGASAPFTANNEPSPSAVRAAPHFPAVPPPPGFNAPAMTPASQQHNPSLRYFDVEPPHSNLHHSMNYPLPQAPQYNTTSCESLRMQDLQDSLRAVFPNANIHIGDRPSQQPFVPRHHPHFMRSSSNPDGNSSLELQDNAIVSSGRLCVDQGGEPHWLHSIRQLTETSDSDALQASWPGAGRQPPPGFHAPQHAPQSSQYIDMHGLAANGSN